MSKLSHSNQETMDELDRKRAIVDGNEDLLPRKCDECGVNFADHPSILCPGCDAYREHTGAI